MRVTIAPTRADTALAVGLVAMAGALLVSSLVGPLALDVVDYPMSTTATNQLLGLEVVTLLLVVPASLAAAVLLRRGHRVGPPLAFAAAAYTAYMFAQYVLGPEYDAYSLVVLLHLALFTLGLVLAVVAWVRAAATSRPVPVHRRRTIGVVLLMLAAFVVSRYAGSLAGAAAADPLPVELAEEPTFYWSIVLLDLGVVVPGTVAAAVAVLRGSRLGTAAACGVVGWFALVPPSVAAMGVAMLVRDDPYAAAAQVVVLGVAALLFAAFAVWVFRTLLGPGRTEPAAAVSAPRAA
jgi:hypothetical protein